MTHQVNPISQSERQFRNFLFIAGVALAVGAVTGAASFLILLGPEHLLLGLRTGALLSQLLVWGGLSVVGVGHILYTRFVGDNVAAPGSDLTLNVDPSQVDRQVEFPQPTTQLPAGKPVRSRQLDEVSV